MEYPEGEKVRTIGLEICDEGILAAEAEDGETRIFPLEKEGFSSPGHVYFDGSEFKTGREAEVLQRVFPRYVSDCCWDQLALRPSELDTPGDPPPYSELAFRHLSFIWKRLQVGGPVDKILLVLPGKYFSGENGDEEKIGLILGMVQELDMRLVELVDLGVFSAAAESRSVAPEPSIALHVDVHLHSTFVTVLRTGATFSRAGLHRSRVGYAQVYSELFPKLANRFLSQTAYDVTHNAKTEQVFFTHLKRTLEELTEQDEVSIEMGGVRRARKMVVTQEDINHHLNVLNESNLHFVKRIYDEVAATEGECPARIFMTERAIRVPGLKEKLRSWKGELIVPLPQGASALTAARYGLTREVVADLEETPITTNVNLADAGLDLPEYSPSHSQVSSESADSQASHGAAPGGPVGSRDSAMANKEPSHIVMEGIGYPIEGAEFVIGTETQENGLGLRIPNSIQGLGAEHCKISVGESGKTLVSNGGYDTLLNSRPVGEHETLKAGDVLSLGNGVERIELYLIRFFEQ